MGLDAELAAETRAWVKRAVRDLAAAQTLLDAEPALVEEAAFHCQQAAEKALKGFLVLHGRPIRKTHSLEEVGEACLGVDEGLRGAVELAAPLSEYAWKFRYPGSPYEPTKAEAAEALTAARSVVAAVLERIPVEAGPDE